MLTVLAALLLTAPDCQAMYRAAKPTEHAVIDDVVCAKWMKHLVIAAPIRRPNAAAALDVIVMKDANVVARLVDEGAAENYSVYAAPKLKLDLAAFKGPDGSPAFGVRVENTLLASSVTDGESSTLNVYALGEQGLKRVVKRLLAMDATRGSVCNDCACGESKLTRTLSFDAKNVLTVKTTQVGWENEKMNGICGRKDVSEKPKSERLVVQDGEFRVPASMSAD